MVVADPEVDFPESDFVKIENVFVIDEHSGSRTVKGKPLVVDEKFLQKIAKNNNENYLFRRSPPVLILGHTKDEDVDESEQPKPVGWATDFKVVPFFRTGKKALSCTWHIRKSESDVITKYPGRSVELYPEIGETPAIALLRKVPERNLPVIKFGKQDRDSYTYILQDPLPLTLLHSNSPLQFSRETSSMPMDNMDPVATAQAGEMKSARGLEAKVDGLTSELKALTSQFQQFMNAMMGALQGGEGEGEDDLLSPAPEGDDFEDGDEKPKSDKKETPKGKDDKKPEPKKDEKKEVEEEPVKMDASQASATNCYIPSDNKDKTKMARENDEVLKFQKETARLAAENREFKLKFNRMKAEKTVAEWETKDHIAFPTEEAKQAEIELMAHLDDESFAAHEKRAKLLYSRKKPAGESVREVQKFARQDDEKGALNSPEDVAAFTAAFDSGRLTGTYEEALAKFKGKK